MQKYNGMQMAIYVQQLSYIKYIIELFKTYGLESCPSQNYPSFS